MRARPSDDVSTSGVAAVKTSDGIHNTDRTRRRGVPIIGGSLYRLALLAHAILINSLRRGKKKKANGRLLRYFNEEYMTTAKTPRVHVLKLLAKLKRDNLVTNILIKLVIEAFILDSKSEVKNTVSE